MFNAMIAGLAVDGWGNLGHILLSAFSLLTVIRFDSRSSSFIRVRYSPYFLRSGYRKTGNEDYLWMSTGIRPVMRNHLIITLAMTDTT